MNLIKSTVAVMATAVAFGISLPPAMAKEESKKISDSVKAMKAISASQKSGIPPAIFKDVVAVAIFPGAAKLEFMVRGRKARGVLLARDGEDKWSSPVLVTLSGGTLGWQAIGEPMDIILLFKSQKNIDEIVKGKLYLGGKSAMIMEGPLGKSMKGATGEQLKAEINSYIFTRGEFAPEAPVADTTMQVDAAATDAFYGKVKISAADILAGKADNSSAEVKSLHNLLTEYAKRK